MRQVTFTEKSEKENKPFKLTKKKDISFILGSDKACKGIIFNQALTS